MVAQKLALVTGGGGGIGQVVCQLLAEQGARVIVTDINIAAAEATVKNLTGSSHHSMQLDVTSLEKVQQAFKTIGELYKEPPSIIINCAGIMLFLSFLEETLETINRQIDINFKGTFFVTQTACKELKAAGMNGSIVNISSVAARGMSWLATYSASKAAVVGMTSAVAKELAVDGIRCNAVCPAPIDTTLMEVVPKELLKIGMAASPSRRLGKPQEVAEVVVFLASERSSFVNGAAIDITGAL